MFIKLNIRNRPYVVTFNDIYFHCPFIYVSLHCTFMLTVFYVLVVFTYYYLDSDFSVFCAQVIYILM